MLAKIGRTVFVIFNHHVNRSVNIYFSENLVTLLMNLCPTRVLKNFDDDQVLCVTHDRIRCFLWSRTLELAGLIEVWVARGGAELPLEFGSVNPIQARGHIMSLILLPAAPGFKRLSTPLTYILAS